MLNPRRTAKPAAGFSAVVLAVLASGAVKAQPCPDVRDVLLTHGVIHTMNTSNAVRNTSSPATRCSDCALIAPAGASSTAMFSTTR